MVAISDKREYLKKLSARLEMKGKDIHRLQAKVDDVSGNARQELLKEIYELQIKKEKVLGNIKKLQETGDEMWEDIKGGVEKSWTELRDAFTKVYSRFK